MSDPIDWPTPREPRYDMDELRARIRATSAVQPDLARALLRIVDMWQTEDRVLRTPPIAAPWWAGGRNSALVDVIETLAEGYGVTGALPVEVEDE